MIYFDNAATTLPDNEVIEVMSGILKLDYGNPSSAHALGRKARVIIEESRNSIADLIRVNPQELFFMSSATEAITTAILGTIRDLGIRKVIVGKTEHHAVLHCLEMVAELFPISIQFLDIDDSGNLNYGQLETYLKEGGQALVIVMYANNEIGKINDFEKVSSLSKMYDAVFLCDMVQGFGKYCLNPSLIHRGFAVCSAHKLHGPKGIGFLYKTSGLPVKSLLTGGGQERNLRSGTENIAGIAGMAKAFEVAHRDMIQNIKFISDLKSYFVHQIRLNFQEAIFNGASDNEGLYNLVHITFPKPFKSEMLVENLDINGIAVSGGSACASGVVHASHVLKAMGKGDDYNGVRFSFGKYNNIAEIDQSIEILKRVL